MRALILDGPHDGELTDCDRPILEFIAPTPAKEIPRYKGEPVLVEPVPLKILTYQRVTFYDGDNYVKLYVPREWAYKGLQGRVLRYFLRKAFKGAAK